MKTIEKTVYNFDELNAEAQEKALDDNRDYYISDPNWHEFSIDFCREVLEIIGFVNIKIYFRGFYSQGDGAIFTGAWCAPDKTKAEVLERLKEEFPNIATDVIDAVNGIFDTLDEYNHSIKYCYVDLLENFEVGRGHLSNYYCHENTIEVYISDEVWIPSGKEKELIDDLNECVRDLCRWIYEQLEGEYKHLTSDSVIQELFDDEWFFDEHGNRVED